MRLLGQIALTPAIIRLVAGPATIAGGTLIGSRLLVRQTAEGRRHEPATE